jgi:hypothetical protein
MRRGNARLDEEGQRAITLQRQLAARANQHEPGAGRGRRRNLLFGQKIQNLKTVLKFKQ